MPDGTGWCSGKSTYLRQVALTIILAQIGCFVPAKFASLRVTHRLFARMGTGDSIENNCSSFMMEMQVIACRPKLHERTPSGPSCLTVEILQDSWSHVQETAYILQHANHQSLAIIDELGRATSTADGVGIAWAVSHLEKERQNRP
jgi:DNA mismatch repair protein MSH4